MNKELLELLDSINEKKALVRSLAAEGKVDEAKAAKEEMITMQGQFDVLKDLDIDTPAPKSAKPVKTVQNETAEAKFANAARHCFKNVMTEGTPADGGYTVPVDISTKIEKLREASFNLGQLVRNVSVTTDSGERTLRSKKKKKGFFKVGEMGKYQATDQPEYFRQKFKVEKYGGYLPVSLELLQDSDDNINNEIIDWLADESRVTRNRIVLEAINKGKTADGDDVPTYTEFAGIDDITRALNVTLGSAYKRTSKIITNDNGFQALCELKDGNGRPMLNPNPAEPAKMQLAVGPLVVPVEVVPNDDLDDVTVEGKQYSPFFIGDFYEGVVLYDRKQFSIKSSDVASVTGLSAFESDCLLFKGAERLDVKPRDTDAYVLGYLAIETKTPTKKKITATA